MDVDPKEAAEGVDKFPIPSRCWKRAERLEEETAFSTQESKVAAMMIFGYSKDEITNELNISNSHYETIIYDRIPSKVERSRQTIQANLKHSPLGVHLQNTLADTSKKSMVGCAGPNCSDDINTNTENPLFNDYYSKTINQHADNRHMMNHTTYHFCSVECLAMYDQKL